MLLDVESSLATLLRIDFEHVLATKMWFLLAVAVSGTGDTVKSILKLSPFLSLRMTDSNFLKSETISS